MKIVDVEKDNYIEFAIDGSISIENIHLFEEHLINSIQKKKNIILILTQVSYIDSISLGVIILNAREAEKNKKTICFVDPNDDITQMFSITGISSRLKIFSTLAEAEAFFS